MCKYFALLPFGIQICDGIKGNSWKWRWANKNSFKLGVVVNGWNKKENKRKWNNIWRIKCVVKGKKIAISYERVYKKI